jgi:hypothetical protein
MAFAFGSEKNNVIYACADGTVKAAPMPDIAAGVSDSTSFRALSTKTCLEKRGQSQGQ